jgi:hypothetical protein
MPPFLLPKWNEIWAIPPLIVEEGNYDNATFFIIA